MPQTAAARSGDHCNARAAHLVPAQRVLRQVVVVQPVVLNQLVHERQRQRGVGAGQQGDVLVAFLGGFAAARIDADQLGAAPLGLLRIAPEVQVAGNRVAAQIRISLASAKNSTRMPSLPPSV